MHCPKCRSDKYTSLPFVYMVRARGSAKTHRCLVCGFLFDRRDQETQQGSGFGTPRASQAEVGKPLATVV
jgi:hypothetical protein